jgi:hypothetical protein
MVIVFSDGCGYQNRNSILTSCNTLCHISKKLGIEICVHVPQNYVDSLASARPSHPYTVYYVDNVFFRKYSELSFYSSIRPGSKVGDPEVTDLRVLHCNPDGTV